MIGQIASVTATNLRSLPARWGASLVVVVGIAGVVGVMVSILAMAEGFRAVFTQAGRDDRVIVMRGGQDDNGMASALTRAQLPTVLNAPGFARGADGKPLVAPQKFMFAVLPDGKTGEEANVLLRGVGGPFASVWPEIKLVEGRWFAPGRRELIAGRAARHTFAGLEMGREVEMSNGLWTVVGIFEAPGTVYESELWGDVEMVFAGYSITGQYSSVVGLLESDAAFKTLSEAITTDPTLSHVVKREPEYYAAQTGVLGSLMLTLGYGVAAIMALGALFSAVNTMHAAVKARSVEIATLRAIGFSGVPIVVSVLLESVALCLIGALAGGALAWLLFNGYTISTLGGQSFNQVAFAFRVTGALLLQSVLWACAVGLLGGLLPAIRAARLPVAEALREA
jgi:putative ABC transport system permease protein